MRERVRAAALRIGIAVAVTTAALVLPRLLPPLAAATNQVEDLATARLSPAEPQHPGIVLITLTEETLVPLACRSPVDRGFIGTVVHHLAAAGVRAVGVDILFDQPTLPDHDAGLRQVLHAAGAAVPVVVITAHRETPLTDRQRSFLDSFLEGVPKGHANLARDRLDGTVRRHVPYGPDGQPSFPAALAESLSVPVPAAPFRIAWRGRPDATSPPFAAYPAETVPLLPRAWLQGRIALIGTTVAGDDRHRTPVSPPGGSTPGVEIQAHVLAQLLDGRVHPAASFAQEASATLALSLAGAMLASAGLRIWVQAVVSAGVLSALWAGAALLFAFGGPIVPPIPASIGWLGGMALTTAVLSLRERTDRLVLMRLFANHVSEPVAAELWRQRASFMAGGRPRPQQLTATVLFSDIEGFTPVCEALPPDRLMHWLEAYMDAMVRIVQARDGIVLRFIGDGILAVFGVPVARTSRAGIDADAARAVGCALDMAAELDGLNARWRAEGLPPVGVRIGIQTGPMVAGSLGGARHMEYSLVGDTVNTAARLEAHARCLPAAPGGRCRIVVGEPTWRAVAGTVSGRPVGTVALRGKQAAVDAWQVLGRASGAA